MTVTTAPTIPAMAPASRPLEWDGALVIVPEFVGEAEEGDSLPVFSDVLGIP